MIKIIIYKFLEIDIGPHSKKTHVELDRIGYANLNLLNIISKQLSAFLDKKHTL
jgi:hypothetical protein